MRRFISALSALLALSGVFVARAASADEACGARLLVLSAFPGEIDPLLSSAMIDQAVELDGFTFYVGTLGGNEVALGLTGIGMVNAEAASRAAFDRFGCAIGGVVFSGVSGGQVRIGDVIVPERWTEDEVVWFDVDGEMFSVAAAVVDDVELASAVPAGDPVCVGIDPGLIATVSIEHTPEILIGGTGRSADPFGGRAFPCLPGGGDVFGCRPCRAPVAAPDAERFVTRAIPFVDPGFFTGYFQDPPATSGHDVDDMETAAVARIAAAHSTPFIAFRALSDGRGDPLMLPGFPFQFFAYRQLAADNAATVALAFLQAWAVRDDIQG